MTEMIWLNGEILPLAEARIGVEDRGFQFADGVYEVVRIYNGRVFTLSEHMDRLGRSCEGIRLKAPLSKAELTREIGKYIEKSPVQEGMIYLQITRGAAPRNHIFADSRPTVLFYSRPLPQAPPAGTGEGLKLISQLDERWQRCWIKSIALLPNVLAKNAAVAAGCDEAVFVEKGIVTECSASNFFAVAGGKVLTHPVGPKVLPGITRLVLADLCKQLDIAFVERPISEAECIGADEVFITSTTREIGWVGKWNDRVIGNGACGAITKRLHAAYQKLVAERTR
ncbi:MAG TPA: D-amino acid aminotransferase [Tepidisphaeraceae bacterium]|jgi:D-alanine transaminase|nr:D-amino acid aminotransferase [Tepidisphaeraceae bacterium]